MPRVDTDFVIKSAAGGVQGAKHDHKHMITHLHQQTIYDISIYLLFMLYDGLFEFWLLCLHLGF